MRVSNKGIEIIRVWVQREENEIIETKQSDIDIKMKIISNDALQNIKY